jgi:hypothetical protein
MQTFHQRIFFILLSWYIIVAKKTTKKSKPGTKSAQKSKNSKGKRATKKKTVMKAKPEAQTAGKPTV